MLNLFKRILSSIFPYDKDTSGNRFLLRNLLLHFRPTTVPESTLKFTLSWGLGGMAAVLILIQLITGTLLTFVYEPFPARAYASITSLQENILFGKLIRNIHYWSANLLVLVAFLHLLRTFFTGAFHGPRRLTWVIGLFIFILILGSNFTGYLLPWDQLAFWAVTICAGMLDYLPGAGSFLQDMIKARPEIGGDTLKIFYSLHTTVFPGLIIICFAFHSWRIRKTGGLVVPVSPDEDPVESVYRVPTVPNLIIRELVVGLMLTALILMLSIFFDAPLDLPANPGLSPNPTKAPWYFAGLQELLLHFHPTIAAWVIPTFATLALFLLPYIYFKKVPSGIWFISRSGKRSASTAALIALVITPGTIILDEYLHETGIGITLFFIILVFITGFYMIVKKRNPDKKNEAIQAVFVMLCTSFIVLTIINIWFRGAEMVLAWPG